MPGARARPAQRLADGEREGAVPGRVPMVSRTSSTLSGPTSRNARIRQGHASPPSNFQLSLRVGRERVICAFYN